MNIQLKIRQTLVIIGDITLSINVTISTDWGDSWKPIPLPGQGDKNNKTPWQKNSIGAQGQYNLNIAVDPKHPGVIYLSGTSLWKGIKDNSTGKWDIRDIGLPIHPDHHAFAFDPTDPAVIYAGSDGGIYKSINGGETWSDVINEGLCITQFEFIDQHPTSEAIIFGGTKTTELYNIVTVLPFISLTVVMEDLYQ